MTRKAMMGFVVDDEETKILKRKRIDMRRLMHGVSISTVGKVYINASSGDMRREVRRIANGDGPVKRAGMIVRYVNRELLREWRVRADGRLRGQWRGRGHGRRL